MTIISAKFLEDFPLYRKLKIPLRDNVNEIKIAAIRLYCPQCKSRHTFQGSLSLISHKHMNQVPPGRGPSWSVADRLGLIDSLCSSCQDYHQFFVLHFGDDLSCVVKVGQFPSWSISIERNLSQVLGEHRETYNKGLICESQGYGIGAYAYYRRIVENIIDDLLNSIHDLLDEDQKVAYTKALKKTQKSIVASEKIAVVKDLLPSILRPNNMNPLNILHDTLSVGIHALTEEECLEVAGDVREILIYLVEQISLASEAQESSRHFTDSMKNLLDRKRKEL